MAASLRSEVGETEETPAPVELEQPVRSWKTRNTRTQNVRTGTSNQLIGNTDKQLVIRKGNLRYWNLNHGHVTAAQLVCQILVFRVIVTEMILELAVKVDHQIPEVKRPVHQKKEFKQSKWHEIEQLVNNRNRRYILKHLKTQIHSRLEQLRDAHFLYNQRLWEAKKPVTDAYTNIIGIEIHVRGASQQVDHYLCDRRDSPVSTVSRATLSQADEDSFVTADEYRYNQQPQTHDPVPRRPMDRTINRYRFNTS
ncbi:hypothetical protein OUZ56_010378 [Daphnia magna]|uniref:Uncharacterized protein n=1 Tax=Daphnia magna TaxID=35525 RepID=A0ABR0AIT5_9CRUS|nr:hypothetical protein OUZ56_010378 [Daphnia magna]